ncbi:Xaa-Pro peptidase family protein [Mesorhizobium sp.]|uniref:M24 family metallopeptidase n=1 Tax=Mesorhizobium sp. TaxID=1871066 RepID=UPI000FE2A984|nr:Xaa-Pro peptidase family protein [Mesorhizobium sp.]RWN48872.1 MAG: M24 family metallopeptidase [Mesorhizobium sp.]RWN69004.1 MAG: M24 family metallopeptidase [Mesorhizobium sp.]RWN69584.1 MAG: M24 family metallopeptidase [Mesorhizobium sp.]RWN81225.1 MAG: M24 family metallopeptidase [Mesorhizobium sp.]RWO05752.1 MAG: M24 family metallopeptidase [Mesorhizobium sp.]
MPIVKCPSPFTADEYRSRIARVHQAMAETGADCMLVTDASNICYLSGYGGDSSYIAQALVVFADEEDPYIILRRQDAPAAVYMTYMANDRVIGYPERFIGDSHVSGFDFIFDWLRGRPSVRGVALEFDAMSGSTLDTIRARQGGFKLLNLSGAVVRHRLVKSPAEIAVMRQASLITDAAMHRVVEVYKPGVRECDAAAEVVKTLIRGTEQFGGDRGFIPNIPGGPQTGAPHLNWSDEPIKAGTHYNPEFAGVRHRYAVGLMRTVSIGKPTEKLNRLHDYMIAGANSALDKARPGATTGQVAQAFCNEVAKGGYLKDSRVGYPLGIDWLETSCSLRTDDPTVLEPGMTFHLMMGMWIEEDFGAVLSESFAVTEGACEVFSKVPRALLVA